MSKYACVRFLSLLLSITLIFNITTGLQVNAESGGYSDLVGHWAAPGIERVISQGIINDSLVNSTYFEPEKKITRAEVVEIVLKATLPPGSIDESLAKLENLPSFPDTINHPLEKYIKLSKELGTVGGYPDGTFQANGNITRAEFSTVMVKSQSEFQRMAAPMVWLEGSTPFTDVDDGHWAWEYIDIAVKIGLIRGYPGGRFDPENSITRAEAYTIIDNYCNIVSVSGISTDTAKDNADNTGIEFDTSSFEVMNEKVFFTDKTVDVLSGVVTRNENIDSMRINIKVGAMPVAEDIISPSKNWSYRTLPLLPSVNTITVTAVLSSGAEVEGVLMLMSIDGQNFDSSSLDINDNDGDKLLNWQEIAIGTDPDKIDTDGDGLSDYEELYCTFSDPLNYDTRGLGMSDGKADFDNDGLSNMDEVQKYRTEPLNPDTDGDDLDDYSEIFTHKTDPLVADTDKDGLNDGWEVFYGYDPLVPNSTFNHTINTGVPNKHFPVTASISCQLSGKNVDSLSIMPISAADDYMLSPTIPGYLGIAYEFAVDGDLRNAKITFDYEKFVIDNT